MEKKTLSISKQTMKRPTIFCWVERIYVGTKPKDDETISFIIFLSHKVCPKLNVQSKNQGFLKNLEPLYN
jgi:hypothetical protein